MGSCKKCSHQGYNFQRSYEPSDFIEGDPSSPVWIIGLNPAMELGFNDTHDVAKLKSHLKEMKHDVSYFRDFRGVSRQLFDDLGEPGGVAHTDIVKCYSKSFPTGRDGVELVSNCSGYLKDQIEKHRPQLLICNGAKVSDYIQSILPATNDTTNCGTSYWHTHAGYSVCVVLSGFLGRIDRFARLRLGHEIESRRRECEARTAANEKAA